MMGGLVILGVLAFLAAIALFVYELQIKFYELRKGEPPARRLRSRKRVYLAMGLFLAIGAGLVAAPPRAVPPGALVHPYPAGTPSLDAPS